MATCAASGGGRPGSSSAAAVAEAALVEEAFGVAVVDAAAWGVGVRSPAGAGGSPLEQAVRAASSRTWRHGRGEGGRTMDAWIGYVHVCPLGDQFRDGSLARWGIPFLNDSVDHDRFVPDRTHNSVDAVTKQELRTWEVSNPHGIRPDRVPWDLT